MNTMFGHTTSPFCHGILHKLWEEYFLKLLLCLFSKLFPHKELSEKEEIKSAFKVILVLVIAVIVAIVVLVVL
jgi:hypothetical protein